MDILQILRAVFGLAIVLGLILALAYVLRRYAPQLLARLQAKRGEQRLAIVETLVLDPARRLVLVRLDGEERLILLGEGHELIEPRPRPAAIKPETAPSRASPPTVSKPAIRQTRATLPVTPATDNDDDLF